MAARDARPVQMALVPPSVADLRLEMRCDLQNHTIHLTCTVTDPGTGELLAERVQPFWGAATLEEAAAHASAFLGETARLVLDPEPF